MTTKSRDLREACVDEALAIIGEVGVESLSIREVARRLGVSHQAPYKHFASADHLLAEIVRRTYATFSAYLENRPRSTNPDQDMQSLGEAYFHFALEHPLHYRLMFGTPLPNAEDHPEMMREARASFTILKEALARKHGKAGKDLQLDALFIWASLHGLASILQTSAVQQLGLQKKLLAQALPHTLARIGVALSRPV